MTTSTSGKGHKDIENSPRTPSRDIPICNTSQTTITMNENIRKQELISITNCNKNNEITPQRLPSLMSQLHHLQYKKDVKEQDSSLTLKYTLRAPNSCPTSKIWPNSITSNIARHSSTLNTKSNKNVTNQHTQVGNIIPTSLSSPRASTIINGKLKGKRTFLQTSITTPRMDPIVPTGYYSSSHEQNTLSPQSNGSHTTNSPFFIKKLKHTIPARVNVHIQPHEQSKSTGTFYSDAEILSARLFGTNDEEDISYSQDLMEELSMHDNGDNLDHFMLDNIDPIIPRSNLRLTLNPDFVKYLTTDQVEMMKTKGIYTIRLNEITSKSTFALGRDQFFNVFGDNFLGNNICHLSRVHCVFHFDTSKGYIAVENKSINGVYVNNILVESTEKKELCDGDIITIYRMQYEGAEISLGYILESDQTVNVSVDCNPSISFTHEAKENAGRSRALKTSNRSFSGSTQRPTLPNPIILDTSDTTGIAVSCTVLLANPIDCSGNTVRKNYCPQSDDISDIFSPFSSINNFSVSVGAATHNAFAHNANHNIAKRRVLLYVGNCERQKGLLVEDNIGMSQYLSPQELRIYLKLEQMPEQPVIIAFSDSIATAQMFVDAGASSVVFVQSTRATYRRSSSYLRAFMACLLRGCSLDICHHTAYHVAMMTILPDELGKLKICVMNLQHSSGSLMPHGAATPKLGSNYELWSATARFLLPMISPFYVRHIDVMVKVFRCLLSRKNRICYLVGPDGIGKSSAAIQAAKRANSINSYSYGAHYVSVDQLLLLHGITSSKTTKEAAGLIEEEVKNLLCAALPHLPKLRDRENKAMTGRNVSFSGPQLLLVLDNCDGLPVRWFQGFLLKLIRRYSEIQLLVTMRESIQTNASPFLSQSDVECSILLSDLSPMEAATLIMSVIPKSKFNIPQNVIQNLLRENGGNPKLILHSASALKQTTVQQLRSYSVG